MTCGASYASHCLNLSWFSLLRSCSPRCRVTCPCLPSSHSVPAAAVVAAATATAAATAAAATQSSLPSPPLPTPKNGKFLPMVRLAPEVQVVKPSHRVAGYSISLWVALPPPPLTLEAQGTVTRLASLCLPQRSGGGDGASLTSLMEIFSCPIHNTWAVGVRVRKGALSPIRPQFDHSCDACMRTIA